MSARIAGGMLWLLAMLAASAHAQTVEYLHTDALGSVMAVTNASRTVLERREYEPYGSQLTPAVSNGPGYTGHVQDATTGLVYMQQRYYDAQIGRFVSVDPVAATIDDFNVYSYARNDPLSSRDPTGAYACSGSKVNCSAIENGLQKAREAHAKMPDGADKNRLGKVLALFGKAGEKNGVNVSFSKQVQYGVTQTEDDGSISVIFNADFSKLGTGYVGANTTHVQAGALGHEGSHALDARAIGRDPQNKREALATERKAYRVHSNVHQALKSVAIPKVWDPSWPAAEVEARRNAAIEAGAQNSASRFPDK